MCLVHTPSAPAPPPPPQYLHNPYLDGASMNDGLNKGRNSLVTSPISNGLSANGGSGPATPPTPTYPSPRPGGAQSSSPNGGLTLPAGTAMPGPQIPVMAGQPGTIVPSVGGALAGSMAGRVVQPSSPPAAAAK